MKGLLLWSSPLLVISLVLSGCGGPKQAAEKALVAAEAAWAVIAEEAGKLASDQATQIETNLAAAREALAKGDAKGARAGAQGVHSSIDALAESLPALKLKLEADWKLLGDSVPGALAALENKLEDFGQPPAGMPERDRFDAASEQLGQLNAQWDEARSLADSGWLLKAIAKAEQVKYEAVKVLTDFQAGS